MNRLIGCIIAVFGVILWCVTILMFATVNLAVVIGMVVIGLIMACIGWLVVEMVEWLDRRG